MRIVQKCQEGEKIKRFHLDDWYVEEKKKMGTKVRPFHKQYMEELQDYLLAQGFTPIQVAAILATSYREASHGGKGRGGYGDLGLSSERLDLKLLKNHPKEMEFLAKDLKTRHENNWLDGGPGGPYILNGEAGYNGFYNATTPGEAALYLNKSYIRPSARESEWNARASVAEDMYRYYYKKGNKIHIKKKNRGKFTASAKAHGMSVQQYASHVLNDPNASPTQKKRANFARNAAKWKH